MALAAIAFAACSGSAENSESSLPSTPIDAAVEADTSANPDGASADSTVVITETPETTEPPTPLYGDFPLVELLTPSAGGGVRPELRWTPIDGADHYGVVVYAPDGQVYWTWRGRSTAVHVGGEPRLDDAVPGPGVIEGMSWAAFAYDADLLPIAVSQLATLSP